MDPGVTRGGRALQEGRFRFLNVGKPFDLERIDWLCPEMSRLWRYNLHYFDYLREAWPSREIVDGLLSSWICNNPPGTPDAWDPYPVSLRIVNWIKLFLGPQYLACCEPAWLRSLYQQARWLEGRVENHLLANHYFKNGKALLFCGMFFAGNDADRWLGKGVRILTGEIEEQILGDGGHFERSPMYHAMILEDCLDLYNLCSRSRIAQVERLAGQLKGVTKKMLHFLSAMSHPDGEIALFNDAALGSEASACQLADYRRRLTGEKLPLPAPRSLSFPDTGYYVLSPEPGNRLIVDCGAVGPDYQPGHAHSDTLSFELSLQGQRVVVDSGCFHYLDDQIRSYNRGNAGHNTIIIDGANQSEMWGAHRCARRARPLEAQVEELGDRTLRFSGGHDGYSRLKGKPIHRREISWSGRNWQISDRVEGGGCHDLESRLHIHPDLKVSLHKDAAVVTAAGKILATISSAGSAPIQTAVGWYCPEFGVKTPCVVLVQYGRDVELPCHRGWVIDTAGR